MGERTGLGAIGALAVLLIALGAGHAASVARADGDPASDILLFADVSLPYSQPVSDAEKARLERVVKKAKRAHYPIKVALISTSLDLGSDDRFTGHPPAYARFLSKELTKPKSFKHPPKSQVANIKVPILIVMDDGIALARRGKLLPTGNLGKLPSSNGPGADPLAEQAVVAVQRLAARAGHPIHGIGPAPPPSAANAAHPLPSQPASSSGGGSSISGAALAGIIALGLLAIAAAGVGLTRVSRRRRAESP